VLHLRDIAKSRFVAITLCVVALVLQRGRAFAGDYGPVRGPYDEPDSHAVDVVASGLALLPMLAVMCACGLLVLPADLFHEARNPADDFGKASDIACVPPAGRGGNERLLGRRISHVRGQEIPLDFPRTLLRGSDEDEDAKPRDEGVIAMRGERAAELASPP
jgi:hypothetical protein